MKVVQLTPYFYPHLGGVESHVLELSKHLQDRGHDVMVVTTQLEDTDKKDVVEGVPVRRVEPLTIELSTPVVPKVRNVLLNIDYDILHSHLPPPIMSFFGVRSAKKKGVPFVLTYHCDLEIPEIFGPLIVEFYQNTMGTYTVSQADKIITTTSTYGATSRAVWYRDADVIPNAVDADRFRPRDRGGEIRRRYGIRDDEDVILYVGRIVYHKGLEYLTESIKHMDKDTNLMLVGTGDFKDSLKEIIIENQLGNQVFFAGRVPNKELPFYYNASDVFVLPSVSRLEAFGIVALEAMASEVPVVVSDIPGVREVITPEENGLLAEPMNPGDIAEKVKRVLNDPEMAKEMGKKGRERVLNNFTWEKVAEDIEEVYEGLV